MYYLSRLSGGGSGINFNSLTNEVAGFTRVATRTEENKHAFVSSGVNLIGRCDNLECRIQTETQSFEMGFGTFNLNKEVYMQNCIVCQKSLTNKDITNIYFFNCSFSFQGVAGGKKKEVKERSTGAGKFISYEDEEP